MKRTLLIVGITILGVTANAQAIYKELEFGMSKKEAKETFRADRDEYINIDLGNGFNYRIYQQNFMYGENGLYGIVFSPKGAALGLSHQNTVSYLEYSKGFFEKLGYEVFFQPEYWNGPMNFNSKYGLLMTDADKNVVVQLYPIRVGNNFLAQLELFNYDYFMNIYDKAKEVNINKAESSGF